METNDANGILNNDLEELERKIRLIGTSDPERYKEFMDRLKDIQNSTLGMTRSDFGDAKYSVINVLTKLQFDFDSYMDGTEASDTMTKPVAGKTKIKRHQINLYTSIVEDLKKFDEIDIEKIRMLRQKWDEEKLDEYLDYLPIEMSIVEEAISDAFLEYQIKYIRMHGNMPQEKVLDYTSNEEYKARIREKLLERANDEYVDAQSKLDIEKYLEEDDLQILLKDDNFWRILTKKDVSFTKMSIDKVLKDTDTKNTETSNLPAVIDDGKSKKQYVHCIAKKKGLFGKEKEKQVKFKIKNGIIYIPERYKDKIISAVVPEGVSKISVFAFEGLSALEKISLPSTLTEIGKNAFKDCISLTEVELPDALKKIGESAFSGCENLEKVNLHPGITSIGDYGFENTAIRELDFTKGEPEVPESKLSLGIGAFKGCQNLEKVKLSKRTTQLHDQLFMDCTSLKEVIYAEGLKTIGSSVYKNCTSLTEMMNIPETVYDIDSFCFENCIKLKKFKMPTFLKYPIMFDKFKMFDRFVLPKQLMNVKILERLNLHDECLLEVPEDAKGYLYEKLGLNPGDKVSYNAMKLILAEKEARETKIEPERTTKMQRTGGRLRMKTVVANPPEIISVDKKEGQDGPEDIEF